MTKKQIKTATAELGRKGYQFLYEVEGKFYFRNERGINFVLDSNSVNYIRFVD